MGFKEKIGEEQEKEVRWRVLAGFEGKERKEYNLGEEKGERGVWLPFAIELKVGAAVADMVRERERKRIRR